MPTLLVWQGHRFRFYALDADEPPHVHIVKDGRSLKVWLRSMEVAHNRGYNERDAARLIAVVSAHREEWIGAWNDFFGL